MPGTYHENYCHSEHKQRSPQIESRKWAELIDHVSYWAGWAWKKHCRELAQQFCYGFCLAVGVMWSDETFLFTAYTGAAASLFGGVTISKAAFLNQQKALSLNDKNEMQDVQILIVEVSFMSDKNLEALDVKLKDFGNRAKPFGGFSIIFAGDFRQLEPVESTEFVLMFSNLLSKTGITASIQLLYWTQLHRTP
jgi:hypothetical protein